jgi:hypothetical protein
MQGFDMGKAIALSEKKGDSLGDSYPTLREPLRGTGTLRERTRLLW